MWSDISLSPAELLALAQECQQRWPDAQLKKTPTGNLSIEVDGEYIGSIDFYGREIIVDEGY